MLQTDLLFRHPPLWIASDFDFHRRPDVCFIFCRLCSGALGHRLLLRCGQHRAPSIRCCGGVRILGHPIKVSADARLSFCSRVIFSRAGELVLRIVRRCGGTEALVARRNFHSPSNLNPPHVRLFIFIRGDSSEFVLLFFIVEHCRGELSCRSWECVEI